MILKESLHEILMFMQIYRVKGIVQPFELGGVTRLIRSAVKFWKAGNIIFFF
jgi:hypothetical protein